MHTEAIGPATIGAAWAQDNESALPEGQPGPSGLRLRVIIMWENISSYKHD